MLTLTKRRMRLGATAALLAAFPPVLSVPALAQSNGDAVKFTLKSVTFNGNQRVSTDTLNAIDGLTIGQKIDRDGVVDAFNKIVDEYKKENVGGSIQPKMATQGHNMDLIFDVTEEAPAPVVKVQPILAHETYTGNVKVSSDTLTPALTIKPGSPVTTEMVKTDLDALGAIYKSAHIGVSITPKITNLPEGKVDINFEIVESKPKD